MMSRQRRIDAKLEAKKNVIPGADWPTTGRAQLVVLVPARQRLSKRMPIVQGK
jgi:hypothetical protein